MATEQPSAATTRVDEIRERVTIAEREGWHGYEQEARDDVMFLLALADARRKEIADLKARLGYPRFAR